MRQEKKLDMQKNNTLIRNTPDQDHDQGKNQNSNRFKPIKTWSHTHTQCRVYAQTRQNILITRTVDRRLQPE